MFPVPKKPWNAGRIIGPKAPLKPKHIWATWQQLKASGRRGDLAMFNCAIDAKLRACDLVRLTVSDVAPGGVLRARSTVIQQKTGRPVPFEITEPTKEVLAAWMAVRGRRADDWLFPSREAGADVPQNLLRLLRRLAQDRSRGQIRRAMVAAGAIATRVQPHSDLPCPHQDQWRDLRSAQGRKPSLASHR